jgi:hypothetical protein
MEILRSQRGTHDPHDQTASRNLRGSLLAAERILVAVVLICSTVLLPACSGPSDTVHVDAFLEHFGPAEADCIRTSVRPEILDAVLGAMVSSRNPTNPETRLSTIAGCASAADLRRGVARVVLETFPARRAPYGIDAATTPDDADDVRGRVSDYPFELAGSSRYRGVKRRLTGRYKLVFRFADDGEPVHKLLIEDIRTSSSQPEGWTAADVVGSMVLETGPASVKGGRNDELVWAIFELGENDDRWRKIVWGSVDGSMVFALEGNNDELMSAIVAELAPKSAGS